MNKMDRRGFLKTLGAGAALLSAPALALGATRQVVVVGGGTGGVSVARALRRADATITVTLIEPDADYYTCYMSNEVVGGGRSLASIRFGYAGVQADGIQLVQDRVSAIDSAAQQVITASGVRLPYDRCIVSPGIDFRYDTVAGYDAS
ncbi:FAD-dependent oxidoreductase, partial [endosymbiont of Ridgeia piscesae]